MSDSRPLSPELNIELGLLLKAVAIALIVVGHLTNLQLIKFPILYPAALGVALFLFVSGYGLAIKHARNQLTVKYIIQKIIYLYALYWTFLLTEVLIDKYMFGVVYSTNILLNSLIVPQPSGPDPSMWFIFFISMLYIVFLISTKINSSRLHIFMVIPLVITYVLFAYYYSTSPLSTNISFYVLQFLSYPLFFYFGLVAYNYRVVNIYSLDRGSGIFTCIYIIIFSNRECLRR